LARSHSNHTLMKPMLALMGAASLRHAGRAEDARHVLSLTPTIGYDH
jgi:hypothetical protein